MTLYLRDYLREADASVRACGARRTAVESYQPRIIAAAWSLAPGARRILRRAEEMDAGPLFRVLVEYAGSPVPLTPEMQVMADRLRSWAPVRFADDCAALPLEIGLALGDAGTVERGGIATLVGRLDRSDLAMIAEERRLRATGTMTSLRRRIAKAILEASDDAIDREAALELARIGYLRNDDVAAVRSVPGTRGCVFDVRTNGGTFRIAPREHALRLGLSFDPPEFEGHTAGARRRVHHRAPTVVPVGALVTFSTTRAADDALHEPDFRDLVERRLDERRVVTKVGLSADRVRACLSDLGYAISTLAEGMQRARS